MRLLLCFLLIVGTADAAPRFVVTKWQPGKKLTVKTVTPVINETPTDAADVAPAPLDCGCAGDPSKCRCNAGKCDCTHCKCTQCGKVADEKPAVQLSPVVAAKMAALERDGVWWDEQFFVEAQKPIYKATAERRKIHVFTPSWCPACKKTKAALGDGDDEIEIVYNTDERGVQGAKYYPAYWNARDKKFYYNVRLDADGKATRTPWIDNSLDNLKAEIGITDPIVGNIQAGEIKRELVERILPLLGWWNGAGVKGPARDIPLGQVTLSLPENFGLDWTTANGVTKFVPSAVPSIKWSFLLDKKVNFVVYDGEQIEFDIPKLPNPVLKIVGPKSMESILPNTPVTTSPKPLPTASIDDAVPPPNIRQPLAATGDWSYPGARERENLINHLMQGQHAGRFSRAQLEMMDLTTLERLHTQDHQRQYATIPKRVVLQRRGGWCPSGNCPNRG